MMICEKMKRNCLVQLFLVVLTIHLVQDGLLVNAIPGVSHKAHPKIDLSDPFYNGQIHYDDTLTETPIGTIVYAIDEESVEVDPFANDKIKTFQLQDVVTHGIPNNKSFINHNLFTIGDGNDAIGENDSVEDDNDDDNDDDDDDMIAIDGVIDKQATAHSKFANFAFNNEKLIPKSKAINKNNKMADKPLSQIQMQHEQRSSLNATDQNTERYPQQAHRLTTTNIAAHLPNRQMTFTHLNNTSTARAKLHRHHNNRAIHNRKWYRRHQKWLKQRKAKTHHNRHNSASRSGLKPQQIISGGTKSSVRDPSSYVQAHVSFYDSSFDDTLSSNRFTATNNHRNGEKWPHLKRLQSQLHQDMLSDTLPPYIKKYSRRNKQLIGLLEGEGMPNIDNTNSKAQQQSSHSRRRQKQTNKWIEKNLFEEQLDEDKKNKSIQQYQQKQQPKQQQPIAPYTIDGKHIIPIILNSKQRYLTEKNVQSEANALPGEHLSLSSEEYNDCDDGDGFDCQPAAVQHTKPDDHLKKKEIYSPKADSFLFHRVATPSKLVGTAAIADGLIKQKLPFVALTDKRIDDGVRRRINTVHNRFPLP